MTGEEHNKPIIFQSKEIRRTWFNDEWWFVIKDIIAIITESSNPSDYLKKLRKRDKSLDEVFKGGGQIVPPLGFEFDTRGGRQLMQCWNTLGIFRLIQSIPSKNAEPFKRWLAKVGKDRIDEIEKLSGIFTTCHIFTCLFCCKNVKCKRYDLLYRFDRKRENFQLLNGMQHHRHL